MTINLDGWMENLQDTALAQSIAESEWLFPTIETLHVLFIVLVVGSILWVDLRLLHWAHRDRQFSELTSRLLPITWAAFILALIAGALMFVSKAHTYYINVPFRLKMLCIVLAGINMWVFHSFGLSQLATWDHGRPPRRARLAGATSIVIWFSVVALGRWIGFTIH